jgi:hypothetical protein
VAILAGRVSLTLDLLAAAQAVGRRRSLAECVARATFGCADAIAPLVDGKFQENSARRCGDRTSHRPEGERWPDAIQETVGAFLRCRDSFRAIAI